MLRIVAGCFFGALVWYGCTTSFRGCGRRVESECRTNLKAAAMAQAWFFEHEGRYSTRVQEVGFVPERANRYAYYFGPGRMQPRAASEDAAAEGYEADSARSYPTPDRALVPTVFAGGVPLGIRDCDGASRADDDCRVTMACARELPGGELDVWSVSTRFRMTKAGDRIRAGEPFHETPPPPPLFIVR